MPAQPSLEQVIAPLASPHNQDRVIASVQKQPPEIAQLIWGAVGTLPTPVEQPSPGISFTLIDPFQQTWTEIPGTRKTSTVQVTNTSDPSQYVSIQRIDGISFSQASGQAPSLQYTGFSSGETTSTSNTESVQQNSVPGGGSVQSTYNLNNSSYDS